MTLDFSRNLHYLFALAPETILCAWGLVVLLRGVREDASESDSAGLAWLTLLGLALAAAANGWLYGVSEVGDSGMVTVDHFRLFANWIFLGAAALSVLISMSYVEKQRLQSAEFYGLVIYSAVGMMLMGGSRDLILLFIALEVMSLAVYVLAAINRRDRRSAEAGLKYFLMGAFASGFLLYGIALVYGATGTTNLSGVAEVIRSGEDTAGLLLAGILLLTVGFGFKVAIVPFHMWTPDVYEGAPSPVTAYMSAAVKAAGFVAFFRVFYTAFGAVHGQWQDALWWLAAITMIAANIMALAQTNVKRMLAYSSIAHAGYLLVALVALNETAAAGLLFYLLVYAVMNIGAFAVIIASSHFGEERLEVDDYAGFGWARPMLGVVLTILLLSLAGFPGTGGFMGKVYLLLGAGEAGLWSLAIILVLTTIASYWYYLRVAWFMWMRNPRAENTHGEVFVPLPLRFALLACVGLILLTGFFPSVALELALASAQSLTDVSAGALLGLGR